VDFAFTVDHLTLVMLSVITGVGFLIHVYSVGYMAHEDGYWRFFAYLNLFMFFMLVLVLSSSFLLLFVGWEGVGLASYLLIGFYFTKDSAANAGKKAFIVNRIGDFGFLLAMFLLMAHFGTLNFGGVFAQIGKSPMTGGFLTAIALLLVVGATGKSAQIPLYIWLPDAMEGPTPVSALIHAATMVTAGIYMVARCHVLFRPLAVGAGRDRDHRRADSVDGGDHRPGAARHQARAGLLDCVAAWVHVPGLRRGCVLGGHLPPDDACVLQGAAVPCGRFRDPCDVG
jgi:NADH:ubiquinone oxidoreductase subunit 5 (subunit L)/multisubunit Na+/H+ antiporter MnhA subunit